MKNQLKTFAIAVIGMGIALHMSACKDLTELNINPNGASEESANPNLLLPTILTETAKKYNELSFGDLSGVMQHTQLDAWFNAHNDYEWTGGILSWDAYYGFLRDNELMRKRAQIMGYDFHVGVSLVMRAYLFGLITDLWGDAPYTDALQAERGDKSFSFPKYDSQETIYKGIIAELKQANELLSRPDASYEVLANADVYFGGKASKWRRFANSLALRYYMRIAEKAAPYAKEGIESMMANPDKFPLITSADDDVVMGFLGNNAGDSWPSNTTFDTGGGSNYRRIKMCATLVDRLQELTDPRLAVWAKKVEIPIEIRTTEPAGTDKIVNGVRIVSPDVVKGLQVDTDKDYVGLPPSVSKTPSAYNLNPNPGQTSVNPHVSYLNDLYRNTKADLLKARLLSAAEVNFILSEAAWKGWSMPESAKTYYERGIQASLTAWGKTGDYASYVVRSGVSFDNTQGQIMEQKWIAGWTTAAQAWFDYRRTGYPRLKAGPAAVRTQLPVRIPYMQTEMSVNQKNAEDALSRIEKTAYSQADNENSAWSKPWLLQGTNKPW